MAESAGGFSKFYKELRRRNVFRVTTVYLIASWILIQIAETTFPALNLPDWTVTFVVVLLAMGFPIAVIFAWAFELTPEGLKKTTQVDPTVSVTSVTGQRINYMIIASLATAVFVLTFTHDWFDTTKESGSPTGAQEKQSIAVLPFVNMSDDNQNEFFSDGLSEELLNVLAQVDGLQVAGRTSSFHFKGENTDLRTIGKELGVEHLLEGSVRKSGDQIRVTAQLVKASDGFHLWSDTYDYQMDDIFQIQDEISLAVVDALKVTLLGEQRERLTKRTTENIEAHNLYLRGRQYLHLRTQESIQQAMKLFEQAVRMDPEYALAYSGLSDAINILSNNHNVFTNEDALERSRPLMERALALDDSLAESWASLGLIEIHANNAEAAIEALKRSMEINPSYTQAYLWYASAVSGPPHNRPEESVEVLERVLTMDPLSRVARNNIAANLVQMGRFEEGEAQLKRAIALDPDYDTSYIGLFNLYTGIYYRHDEALRWLEKAYEMAPDDTGNASNFIGLYLDLGMEKGARKWAAYVSSTAPNHPFAYGMPSYMALYEQNTDQALIETEKLAKTPVGRAQFATAFRIQALMLANRNDDALELAREHYPAMFEADVELTDFNDLQQAGLVTSLLVKSGDKESATSLLEAWRIFANEQMPDESTLEAALAMRALAADEYDGFVQHLTRAVDLGWRRTIGINWTLDKAPATRIYLGRPEFDALVERIAVDIAKQRARAEQHLRETNSADAI
jgi:TolB-like protein